MFARRCWGWGFGSISWVRGDMWDTWDMWIMGDGLGGSWDLVNLADLFWALHVIERTLCGYCPQDFQTPDPDSRFVELRFDFLKGWPWTHSGVLLRFIEGGEGGSMVSGFDDITAGCLNE